MKESFAARMRRLAAEASKFLTVGGLGYIVDVGLSNLLAYGFAGIPALLDGSPIKAKIVSTLVSMVVVWLGNKLWTYGDRTTSSDLRGIGLFIAVNLVGMVITVIPLGVTWYLLDMRDQLTYNLSTNVIGIGLAMVFRFYAYRTWVFKDTSPAAEVVVEMSETRSVDEAHDADRTPGPGPTPDTTPASESEPVPEHRQ